MTEIRRKFVYWALLIASMTIALYFFVTVVIGIFLSYTSVPILDMWDSTVGFYLALQNGNTSIWWAPHNEHRIVLSRLLFWLDLKLTDGRSILSLATHPTFAALSVYTFYLFYKQLVVVTSTHSRLINILVASFLTAWLFQWIQHENFAWAFQSQFFMAQLLPLMSLYLLARSSTAQVRRNTWFLAACVLGIASAGTMANGVICLPILVVYSLITRQSLQRVLVLTVLAITTLSLYFWDFHTPAHHSSVTQSILSQPLNLARYVLLYIGGPFYYLWGGGKYGLLIAMSATTAMAAYSVYILVTPSLAPVSRPDERHRTWQLALVFYIIYLAGTALGTGGGRLVFGVEQALAPRYTTPALMAWAALFILCLPTLVAHWQKLRLLIVPAALVLLSQMVVQQTNSLESHRNQNFERAQAVLALELDIKDREKIRSIYPSPEVLINITNVLRSRKLSVFGYQPWIGLRERISEFHDIPRALPTCLGHLDTINQIEPEIEQLRVQGWLMNSETTQPATLITILDSSNIVIGFALGGQIRNDVANAHGHTALNSGFGGYIEAPERDRSIRLIADNNACELVISALPSVAGETN